MQNAKALPMVTMKGFSRILQAPLQAEVSKGESAPSQLASKEV